MLLQLLSISGQAERRYDDVRSIHRVVPAYKLNGSLRHLPFIMAAMIKPMGPSSAPQIAPLPPSMKKPMKPKTIAPTMMNSMMRFFR